MYPFFIIDCNANHVNRKREIDERWESNVSINIRMYQSTIQSIYATSSKCVT